jgi:hypothetical protein
MHYIRGKLKNRRESELYASNLPYFQHCRLSDTSLLNNPTSISVAVGECGLRSSANTHTHARTPPPHTHTETHKYKAVPQHTYGGAEGRGGIARTLSRPRHYMGVSGQRHSPAALYSRGKDPGTHWTGGWVGRRAGLDSEVRGKM